MFVVDYSTKNHKKTKRDIFMPLEGALVSSGTVCLVLYRTWCRDTNEFWSTSCMHCTTVLAGSQNLSFDY